MAFLSGSVALESSSVFDVRIGAATLESSSPFFALWGSAILESSSPFFALTGNSTLESSSPFFALTGNSTLESSSFNDSIPNPSKPGNRGGGPPFGFPGGGTRGGPPFEEPPGTIIGRNPHPVPAQPIDFFIWSDEHEVLKFGAGYHPWNPEDIPTTFTFRNGIGNFGITFLEALED